jgi:hypothetical protein
MAYHIKSSQVIVVSVTGREKYSRNRGHSLACTILGHSRTDPALKKYNIVGPLGMVVYQGEKIWRKIRGGEERKGREQGEEREGEDKKEREGSRVRKMSGRSAPL